LGFRRTLMDLRSKNATTKSRTAKTRLEI
jgi:hypothetical protein